MKKIHQRIERRNVSNLLDSLAYDWLNRGAGAVASRRGHKMAVFANDPIGNSINIFGAYEREELATLFDFLSPLAQEFAEGSALDIGANIGNHAICFSQYFGTVHAYEPNPESFELLEFNSRYKTNVIVHNVGIGEIPGQYYLSEKPTNLGEYFVDESGTIEIDIVRLDDLDVQDVRFIKIDVEGFELKVLAGGLNFLKVNKPIVAFEQLAQEFDGDSTPTIRFLSNLGYRFCWLEDGAKSNRRMASFVELITGRTHMILSGVIPPRTHPLIVALPPGCRL